MVCLDSFFVLNAFLIYDCQQQEAGLFVLVLVVGDWLDKSIQPRDERSQVEGNVLSVYDLMANELNVD